MNEIESYIDRKNEEVWEYLPEWMRILRKITITNNLNNLQ